MKTARIPIAVLLVAPFSFACGESQVAASDAPEAAEAPEESEPEGAPDVERARAILVSIGESGVSGEILFEDVEEGVRITGRVEGLEPGLHGFHVHRYGDLSDRSSGASAGDHFAPEGSPHGRPSDEERHVGDLGNIEAGEDGVATIDMLDDLIALDGPRSIVGRAVVVHAQADQFTQPAGDAGDRVAFAVIGIAEPVQ